MRLLMTLEGASAITCKPKQCLLPTSFYACRTQLLMTLEGASATGSATSASATGALRW